MLSYGLTLPANTQVKTIEVDNSKRGTAFPANPVHLQSFEMLANGAADAGIYTYDQTKTKWQRADAATFPYDIALAIMGKPDVNKVVAKVVMVRPVIVPQAFAGSLAKADVQATAAFTFTMKVNGNPIGTVVFAAGSTNGVFTPDAAFTRDLFIETGDTLTVATQAAADATLAFPAITIMGRQVHV